MALPPPVIEQVPPLSTVSARSKVIASQSFGLLTVIEPDVAQPLSVPLSWDTATV